MGRNRLFAVLLAMVSVDAVADLSSCFESAGQRYDIAPDLLRAIAAQESGFRATAEGRNVDGSRDIGVMQINTSWLPQLAEFGLSERDLWEPCVNVNVGAWVLANNIARYGYTWDAIGAYNAGTATTQKAARRREEYAQKVAHQLDRHRHAGGLLIAADQGR